MTTPRRICVVTGTRAEYGLLCPLMRAVDEDPELVLQTVVTGTHLDDRFGRTEKTILADGFQIDWRVDPELADDNRRSIAHAMARTLAGLADAFDALAPDVIVVLGDRWEILAAAQAAMILRIPLAHIHGGETTEGAMDESIRHAITKMAHLHFPVAKAYRQRILQLGEAPERVTTIGAPVLDNIANLAWLDKSTLSADLGFAFDAPYFLVTYHPVTLSHVDPVQPVTELLAALDQFPDHGVMMTGVNADPGFSSVEAAMRAYALANPERVMLKTSLGQARYMSAMRHCAAVVGNSSSGIIEAPIIGVPTVNIGDRQRGRLRSASIIDCVEECGAIVEAMTRALTPAFQQTAAQRHHPYGIAGSGVAMKDMLKTVKLDDILMKQFQELSGYAHD